MVKIAHKIGRAVQPAFRLCFGSCAMKDVDHDALWKLSSLEAHSTFSNERKRAVVCRHVVDSKAATRKKVCSGCQQETLLHCSGFRHRAQFDCGNW